MSEELVSNSKGRVMTFELITDSTADLDEEWINAHNVEVLGLTIQLNGRTYKAVGENRLASEVLLEGTENGGRPATSQVNVGQFKEGLQHHARNGDEVLYLVFSFVLPGIYQNSMIAHDTVLEESPQVTIGVVDTLTTADGEGYLSISATQAHDGGRSLEETEAMIINILSCLRTYFLADDLYHLVRGGRLSEVLAIVGDLVNIKPLLWVELSERLAPLARVCRRKRALEEVVSQATQSLAHNIAVIAYASNIEDAGTLKKSLLEYEDVDHVLTIPLGLVISAHVGSGALAVSSIGRGAG